MKVDRKGFTALELIVVVGVVGVLMGLMVPAVMEARNAASRVQCESNLRQIGLALQLYSDAHHGEMPTQLRPALDDYADNEEELWRCPHDHDFTEKNSYAKYYIPRADFPVQDGWQILVRCPRHPNQQGWLHTTVHGLTEFEIPNLSSITEGVVHPVVQPNTRLPDGSTIEGQNLMVVMCRREGGGLKTWHVVIGLPPTPQGVAATGTFEVHKGSRFEVLSPAGLAAVEGTQFTVTSQLTPLGKYQTTVTVQGGTVRVMEWEESTDGELCNAGGYRVVQRSDPDSWGKDGPLP